MSDFARVKPGDRKIKAKSFNTMLDAARYYHMLTKKFGSSPFSAKSRGVTVDVKYDAASSEDPVGIGAVLGIDSSLFSPTDNLIQFQTSLVLNCIVPVDPDHTGRFVIAAEPIVASGIGSAYVAGVCPVQVNITDADHLFADIEDGDVTQLTSMIEGSARILTSDGTGLQWCYVLLTGVPGVQCLDES